MAVLLGAIMQASVFGSVATIMQSINAESNAFESKSSAVLHRMKVRQRTAVGWR